MRHLTMSALCLTFLALVACGGAGGGADDANGGGGGTNPLPGIYVNVATGSDTTGDGSFAKPYKTIRRGLQGAGIGETVRVAAGTYDEASGERFPIIPGFGVTIVGTELKTMTSKLRLTKIVGGGFWSGDLEGRLHATIVPNTDNHLYGLSIKNPQPFVIGGAKPAAVLLAYGKSTVESCTLHGSDKGIRMVGGVGNTYVNACTIVDNGIGILVDGAGANNRVEDTLITDNVTGVMMFTLGADFGGGEAFSFGGNAFVSNDTNDFVNFTGEIEPVHAEGCFWDHAFPTIAGGNPANPADADVWVVTLPGNVIVTGAQIYDPSNPWGPDLGDIGMGL